MGPSLLSAHSVRRRLDDIADVPYPVVLDPEIHYYCTISRLLMSHFYGGSSQAMCPPLGAEYQRKHPYRNFMFPNLNMNPDLPKEPGQHGLLCRVTPKVQWAEGRQKLLVGLRPGEFRYMGEYVLERAESLSVEEFNTLPEAVR